MRSAGVRNAQARNLLKQMRLGDQLLFYYSSCKEPGIVAICEVVREAYPDHTAWEEGGKYFDATSTPDKPKWCACIDGVATDHCFITLHTTCLQLLPAQYTHSQLVHALLHACRFMVDIKFKRRLQRFISLQELKSRKDSLGLGDMLLFSRPRLSVQPVSQEHVQTILALEHEEREQDA